MSNHFFRITSNGGYIGRLCWANTGASGTDAVTNGWGWFGLWPGTSLGTWAGSLWIVRYLTR